MLTGGGIIVLRARVSVWLLWLVPSFKVHGELLVFVLWEWALTCLIGLVHTVGGIHRLVR